MRLSYKSLFNIVLLQMLLLAMSPTQALTISLDSTAEGGNSVFSGELLILTNLIVRGLPDLLFFW